MVAKVSHQVELSAWIFISVLIRVFFAESSGELRYVYSNL